MKTLDLRRELKPLYAPSARRVELIRVPKFKFVMIDGQIEPGAMPGVSPEFQAAIGALYGMAFTLKFMSKLRPKNPIDYPVMALEALWWTKAGEFDLARPGAWKWTAMMLLPAHITPAMFEQARRQLRQKRPGPAAEKVRLESFREGLCVQTMHIGPYAAEPETIARMKDFAREHGYVPCGRHHEIYLGNPLRARPERLKTILRHPVAKAAAGRRGAES